MVKKHFFIATVHIVVDAEDTFRAEDVISACLFENLQHSGDIIDWGYVNPQQPPKDIGEYEKKDYEEGDLYSYFEGYTNIQYSLLKEKMK